jgi:hypothetical protein
MAGTITSISNYTTYTLGAPLTNGTSLEFVENLGTTNGVLLLNDNSASSAFAVTTTATGGSLHAYATIGGSVLHFGPAYQGVGPGGNQISIEIITNIFDALDVAATAASDNANFAAIVAADPDFAIDGGTISDVLHHVTLNANEAQIVDQIAVAILGGAATAATAALELSFNNRQSPNSNNVLVDGVLRTEQMINPCFAAGTRILTPRGEVAVELLGPGDRVITHSGVEAAIVWAGRREIELTAHPTPLTVRPVTIAAGALADGVPARALTLSPDHALWLDGVLVPAKALLNWTSIRQDLRATRIAYHHIELARHDIVFAEGCPVESFLDTGHKGVFGDQAVTVHPAAMQARREVASCAPLCEEGAILATIRLRIAARRGDGPVYGAGAIL